VWKVEEGAGNDLARTCENGRNHPANIVNHQANVVGVRCALEPSLLSYPYRTHTPLYTTCTCGISRVHEWPWDGGFGLVFLIFLFVLL